MTYLSRPGLCEVGDSGDIQPSSKEGLTTKCDDGSSLGRPENLESSCTTYAPAQMKVKAQIERPNIGSEG